MELTRINVEPFLEGGREKGRFKMLSSTNVTWNIDIPWVKFFLPCFWCSNDSVSTVWYAKYEGVYFLGFISIFKGFDNFSKTERVID